MLTHIFQTISSLEIEIVRAVWNLPANQRSKSGPIWACARGKKFT
jgi:hypothetical protein